MTATPGARPQLAVSAVIFRNDQLLLVRRAREPGRGLYSVPGGRVEHGETLHEAAAREVREETSLAIDIVGFAGWREVLPDLAAGRAGHYLVISFAARWRDGEVALNDELDEFRWLDAASFDDLTASRTLRTTQGLRGIVGAARKLIEA
ncbi:MAG: NUDIX hydrolase [Rhizobiales bacterium 62-47]|nr:NUDIX hydrolase [Hyphomicrobiales bacterium]OJY11619.1 MAG: NUDIX hydrolase [Rhizobiales bacterium 62-47]